MKKIEFSTIAFICVHVNVPIELSVTLRNDAYSKDLGDSQMRKRKVKILFF